MGDLSSLLICSIIYLYQYRLMDSDCILWVIIKYYLLILFNFPSSGHWEHSQLASLPLWNTPINVLLLSFEKALEGLYISCLSHRTNHWSKEPQLLLLGHSFSNHNLHNGPTCCQLVVFAKALSADRDKKYECVLTCVWWTENAPPPPKKKISTLNPWILWMYIIWEDDLCNCHWFKDLADVEITLDYLGGP